MPFGCWMRRAEGGKDETEKLWTGQYPTEQQEWLRLGRQQSKQ